MKLKDTLSQSFKEVNSKIEVSIYSCGPTVYDYPHVGNWYAFLRWDLLVRSLKIQSIKTKWVMNITDVGHLISDADEGEDKLVSKAQREQKTAYELAQYYGDYFLTALKRLNFNQPDYLPKATEYIDEQIDLVKQLEEKGLTYLIDDGLYCDTSKINDYGKLAQRDRQGFQAGARVDFNQQKRNVTDFALWKLSPKNQTRDMQWDSPWGKGFPGWHLECSAMAQALLGNPITIHAGGIDHIPIHHTNELAQSEPIFGQPMADIWLHSNFVTINGQKMSKSLNNFYTLEDIEKKNYSLEAFRLAVFSSRYFNLVDFNWQLMKQSSLRLLRLQNLSIHRFQLADNNQSSDEVDWQTELNQTYMQIIAALNDNLNSPLALEYLDQLSQRFNSHKLTTDAQVAFNEFIANIDHIFGLSLININDINNEQKDIIAQRQIAKEEQNYELSDKLRHVLLEQNVLVLDTNHGQIWQLNQPI